MTTELLNAYISKVLDRINKLPVKHNDCYCGRSNCAGLRTLIFKDEVIRIIRNPDANAY